MLVSWFVCAVVLAQLDGAGNVILGNNDHREGPPLKKVRAQFS
jgi:hypothetical protein